MYKNLHVHDFTNPSGEKVHRVAGSVDGKEIRRNFKTRLQANQFMAEVIGVATPSQGTTEEVRAAVNTLENLSKEQLAAILSRMLSTPAPAAAATPAPVAPATTGTLVESAIQLFISAKTTKRLRPRSLSEYRSRLGTLRPYYSLPVSAVTCANLEPLIFKEGQAARTANQNRRVLFTFFKWCRKKHYCTENPAEEIERSQVEEFNPKTFTVAEVSELLRAAAKTKRKACLPYIALGFFAGIRPKELSRLQWGVHIQPRAGLINITADIAKLRGKRPVEFIGPLAAWLKLCDGKPVCGKNFRRRLDAVRRAAGFKASWVIKKDQGLKEWPEDGIRHTALSMHYQKFGDENKTAKWAGNSPETFHKHYKDPISTAEAEKFWSLTPEAVLGPKGVL